MPTGTVKKYADKYDVSVKTAEKEWADSVAAAKDSYGEPTKGKTEKSKNKNSKIYGTATNIFKNKMKKHHGNEAMITKFADFINESTSYVEPKRIISEVIIVDADNDFDDNPLFYVWTEYPKYKKMANGTLLYQYEFYTDNSGNKYLIADGVDKISDEELKELISKVDWNYARNVDEFVEGADKDDYARWLDLIS